MITDLLIKRFIPSYEKVNDPQVRTRYTMLASVTGVLLNCLLSAGKLAAGLLFGSVAIIADAFNNLSDAGSAVITAVGVRLSGKHADKQHPLGHGRLEYIAAFIVDMLIILVGAELLMSAIDKIRNPVLPAVSSIGFAFLGIAVITKLWMFFFYRKLGKAIDSSVLRAVSLDSLTDMVATGLVLGSALCARFISLPLDGWVGLLVAGFVLYTGLKATGETITLLLGTTPRPELVAEIYDFVGQYPEIIGIHDLMVHDYGPGRKIITLHAEVPETSNLIHAHDIVDGMELQMQERFSCIATIHLDPISVGDEKVDAMRRLAEQCALEVDPSFTIHDFRVTGGNCNNLIFDLCIPTDSKYKDEDAAQLVARRISETDPNCRAVIRPEHPFL